MVFGRQGGAWEQESGQFVWRGSSTRFQLYVVDVKPAADLTYPDALILAMKKEKDAFRLYLLLSEETNDPAMKTLFLSLAQEESRHKLRFELEYDDFILKEN